MECEFIKNLLRFMRENFFLWFLKKTILKLWKEEKKIKIMIWISVEKILS